MRDAEASVTPGANEPTMQANVAAPPQHPREQIGAIALGPES
ncbi:MAG TPA: hypothetical protein VIG32_09460 [Candidatus Baltobacteraceae bacterium]